MAKSRNNKGPSFVRLYRHIKRSQAYHDLGPYARLALIDLLDGYTGINNGMIRLGVRELATSLNCAKDTAARALRDLDDSGLAQPTYMGNYGSKKATEWRIMFHRDDRTGALPVTKWPKAEVFTGAFSPTRRTSTVREVGQKRSVSPARRTQTPKIPINEKSVSPAHGTLLESSQGGRRKVTFRPTSPLSAVAAKLANPARVKHWLSTSMLTSGLQNCFCACFFSTGGFPSFGNFEQRTIYPLVPYQAIGITSNNITCCAHAAQNSPPR